MNNPAPIPWNVPVLQLDLKGQPLPSWGLSKEFGNWLQTSVVASVAATAQFFTPVNLINQSATIATTPIPLPALAAGAYRIQYYVRKTTADGVSSSLTVTFSWTEGGQALSLSGAALTTDAVTAVQTGISPILIDASTPISYAVAYASNTPGQMKFRLYLLLETL